MKVMLAALLLLGSPSLVDAAERPSWLPKGIGCWPLKAQLAHPLIGSEVFGWYITDVSNLDDFKPPGNRPLFASFAGHKAEVFLEKLEKHRDRIAGAVWDYEHRGTPVDVAERELQAVHAALKSWGKPFGVTSFAASRAAAQAGIDYQRARGYADFLMPMMYAQWFGMRREPMEGMLAKTKQASRLPVIALLALETTKTKPPRLLTPAELRDLHKGLRVDGFAIWNIKGLEPAHLEALKALR
jgi:hypothetical protein